jgi:hypothetical protein
MIQKLKYTNASLEKETDYELQLTMPNKFLMRGIYEFLCDYNPKLQQHMETNWKSVISLDVLSHLQLVLEEEGGTQALATYLDERFDVECIEHMSLVMDEARQVREFCVGEMLTSHINGIRRRAEKKKKGKKK